MLAETDTRVTVLDREEKDQVNVVGDVRSPTMLEEASIQEATAAIIAVDDDTTAIFATLIMRELNPNLYIIVRANKEEDEQKLYRARADYVQSLATVSGRMMASTMLEDEEVFTLETQIEIARLPAGRLEEQALAEANVRNRTGATVLAVMRSGEADPLTELGPESFRFAAGDEVADCRHERKRPVLRGHLLWRRNAAVTKRPRAAPNAILRPPVRLQGPHQRFRVPPAHWIGAPTTVRPGPEALSRPGRAHLSKL